MQVQTSRSPKGNSFCKNTSRNTEIAKSVHPFSYSSPFYAIPKILCFTMLVSKLDNAKSAPSRTGIYISMWTQHSKRHLGQISHFSYGSRHWVLQKLIAAINAIKNINCFMALLSAESVNGSADKETDTCKHRAERQQRESTQQSLTCCREILPWNHGSAWGIELCRMESPAPPRGEAGSSAVR